MTKRRKPRAPKLSPELLKLRCLLLDIAFKENGEEELRMASAMIFQLRFALAERR